MLRKANVLSRKKQGAAGGFGFALGGMLRSDSGLGPSVSLSGKTNRGKGGMSPSPTKARSGGVAGGAGGVASSAEKKKSAGKVSPSKTGSPAVKDKVAAIELEE